MPDVDVGRFGGEPDIQPSARDEARAERRAGREAVSGTDGVSIAAKQWAEENGLIKPDQKSFGPKPVAAPNDLLERVANALHADAQKVDPVAALQSDGEFMAALLDRHNPGHAEAMRKWTGAHMSPDAPGNAAPSPALAETEAAHNADQAAIFAGAPLDEPGAMRALNGLNLDWTHENGEPASTEDAARANSIIATAVAGSGMPQTVLGQLVLHASRPGGIDEDAARSVMGEYADKLGEQELQRRVAALDRRLTPDAKKLLAAFDLDFSPSAVRELLEWSATL